MSTNTVTAAFGASKVVRTRALYQWDYGQILRFAGLDLPDAYTVHFSNQGVGGEAKTMVGNSDGVDIPDEYLTTGQAVYAWVFLHAGEDDGETVYAVVIPVVARPKPTEDEPTPQQQGVIDQAIAALNAGVEAAEEAAESVQNMGVEAETLAPGSEATVEKSVDPDSGAVTLAFGIPRGEQGVQGPQGIQGIQGIQGVQGERGLTGPAGPAGATGATGATGPAGADGVSPEVSVTDITGGHRVTITDADGTKTFDVMDGEQGPQGETGPAGTDGQDGAPGPGVAAGGTDGQMLVKDGSTDYATKWANQPSVPVQDVQVNGTSILSSGVANVPIAGNNGVDLGVLTVAPTYGLNRNSSGRAFIQKSSENEIKNGVKDFNPIVPLNQHVSTFYGLAKAAGSDMASSSNPVGTYTDAAKVAIQKMLGVYREWELIANVTVTEDSQRVDIDTDIGGQPFELSEMLVRAWFEPSTTGTNDYISAICLATNTSGDAIGTSAPTLRYQSNGAKTFFEYKPEICGGVAYITGGTSSLPNSTTSLNKISSVIEVFKCFRGFRFDKYGSNTTLIPAGTVIKIYGIRI